MARKDNLSAYRAKRDFERTSEPSPDEAAAADDYPRFVVQKHDASRLHYDLRLEVDGVFKSWAVTKGPSPDPHDKRLAVEVEDHPLAYGDFEGTIPKGEYGGGTVMLWDRGYWQQEGGTDAEAALRKGELKFTLAGEKMKGSWVLVRLRRDRNRGKQPSWLLIKHRDDFAQEGSAWIDDDVSVASGRSMDQIAAGRGRKPRPFITRESAPLRADAVWSTRGSGKAAPATARHSAQMRPARFGTLPKFIAPQLCKLVAHPPEGAGWLHEIKLDGYRLQVRVADSKATVLTRSGENWTRKFPKIAAAAQKLPDCILDGEVVALDAHGTPSFAALQAALSDGKADDLVFFAFDLLAVGQQDIRPLPLRERKSKLRLLLQQHAGRQTPLRFLDDVSGDGGHVLDSARRLGLEGIVSKKAEAHYHSGRTGSWVKCKCRLGHEVVIGGWSGSAKTLRSLVTGVYADGEFIYVGQVGTGFNVRNTPPLLEQLGRLATRTSPFTGKSAPRRKSDWTWVKPQLVCEIEFAGWTGGGMVRQAAFKALRADKPAKEVQAEFPAKDTPLPQPGNEARPQTMPRKKAGSDVRGITISNPDKALWPAHEAAAAVTKLDLARYLEDVGPWMMPHLSGRPCSLVRAPDGIDAETWFQRHAAAGHPASVSEVKVEGDRKPYLQIDDVEGLIAMAQLAAVEFHPWNNRPGDPTHPGRLVFDLDPGDEVPFSVVVEAARELRERLEASGLVPFCKTTGGKGLHLVVPLKEDAAIGWDEAKGFAEAVCAMMAADSPSRYVVNMAKRQRHGRIYLDYLRNDRMATAVAVLSPRARPGACVSMPLNWSQVRSGLDPKRFTIATAARLLPKVTDWNAYEGAARKLSGAIRKLR